MNKIDSGEGMTIYMKSDATERQTEIARKMYPNATITIQSPRCKKCGGILFANHSFGSLCLTYFCSECGIESKDVDSIGYEDEGE